MNYLKQPEALAASDTQEFNMIKTKMNKIYISGRISSDPDFKEKFKEYANYIDNLYPQYYTINPAEVVLPTLCDWEDYMCICLHLLKQCDAIFMLPDWKESKGACVEHETAIKMNIPIFYEL